MNRIKLQNIINLIKIVATGIVVFRLVQLIFFENPRDYKEISQYATLLVTFTIYFIKVKKKPVLYQKDDYEKMYKDVLDGAFAEDKRNYNKLIKCVDLYTYKKYKDAHTILNSLEQECVYNRDYIAVHAFRGLCYAGQNNDAQAIEEYKKVLEYDMSISDIWNNLGLCYLHQEDIKETYEALSKAIMFNTYNMTAYINMANYFHTFGKPDVALHYVNRALEYEPNNRDVLAWAALTYTKLGDAYQAKCYSDLYIKNGGSKATIRKMNRLFARG